MDIYQKFIHQRTYARWDYAAGRRESWEDSVDRVGDFFTKIASKLTKNKDLHSYLSEALVLIREQEIVPSMRVFWTAGPALEREHLGGYNCAAIAIDSLFVLPEILYMLMCGTGVGFSVESHFINKISPLPSKFTKSKKTIVFEDSKQGWAEGYKQVIASLYEGQIPQYDMSKIRPKGAILKTFGGRSSGPEALIDLIETTIKTLVDQKGAPLRPIQVHDLACAVLSTVVVGGVRRAAGISLSDLGDLEMAQAKTGEFWHNHPQRCMTNNSAVYTSRPAPAIFLQEWINLIRSKSGERGIFNREAANFTAARTFRRKLGYDWLCNPCTEVVLRPDGGLCNLSEVIVRPDDTLDMLCQKVTGATLLGVLQSTLTKFNFVNKNWRRNAEEERLLGVSLTGLMDHPVLQRTSSDARLWLKHMKQAALDAAEKYSKIVGIPMPAAVTCLKPSGTVSQLCNTSSGLHARFAEHYIRRVRVTATDPLARYLIDKGVPHHPEVGEDHLPTPNTWVFDFPIKAPECSITRDQLSAKKQLEYWKMIQTHWCEQSASCTIYVNDDEWPAVAGWVYNNWNVISGLSFLPKSDSVYQLAPYEEIPPEQYKELVGAFPTDLNFDDLSAYEAEDYTTGSQELACTGGACEL